MAAGIYIHVPFCRSKCPYCDFYSFVPQGDALDAYTARLLEVIAAWGDGTAVDTLYFGGGTPSLLGGDRLAALIGAVRRHFAVAADSEITREANPADDLYETLAAFAAAGGNRVSFGMQAGTAEALARLGRRHRVEDVPRAVLDARRAGIHNLSLDLMIGTPGQSDADALADVERALELSPQHLSAYLLKIEPDTPFGKHPPADIADEEAVADRYLAVCEAIEKGGLSQYEISNFAREGFESRHNSKYWDLTPYLGIGPAAASFWQGKRLLYPRDFEGFLGGNTPVEETDAAIPAGSPEEYLLLRLRTVKGLSAADYRARFGTDLPKNWRDTARKLPSSLIVCDADGIRLTRRGFLLSNAIIAEFL